MTHSTSVERQRRRARLSALAVSTIFLSGSAVAQDSGSHMVSVPAEQYAISPTGVDMRTGGYAYSVTDLSIGQDANSGLQLTRTMVPKIFGHDTPFGEFSSNWDIVISERRIDVDTGAPGGTGYRMIVYINGRAETFDAYGKNYGFSYSSVGQEEHLTSSGDRDGSDVLYTYTESDGTIIRFRALGNGDCVHDSAFRCAYASQIVRPDGTTFDLAYNSMGVPGQNLVRLSSVTSNRGYGLVLEGATDASPALAARVTKACVINLAQSTMPAGGLCPTGVPSALYTYDQARLSSVTDPVGQVSSFKHTENPSGGYTMGLVKAGATNPWQDIEFFVTIDQDYAPQYAVSSQYFADGRHIAYSYVTTPADNSAKTIAGGSYVDQAGRGASYAYDFPIKPLTGSEAPCYQTPCHQPTPDDPIYYQQTAGPVSITDALGRTISADYCDPNVEENLDPKYNNRCLVGELRSFTDPEGVTTKLTYSGREVTEVRRIAKAGGNMPDIVTSATYDCSNPKFCTKPQTYTDGNNHTTEYTYSADHGGVLTATSPADANGVQPVKRYAYAQRSAWIWNGSGYVQGGPPVWLLVSEKTCRTTATSGDTCAGGSADEVVTTFDYGPDSGPNTLLLRGTVVSADGQARRTCFGYDAQGNRISQTTPRAGLTVCP